ncbi:MAG: cytochrome c3 family protein, partial [Gemmatimonadota bacterium]
MGGGIRSREVAQIVLPMGHIAHQLEWLARLVLAARSRSLPVSLALLALSAAGPAQAQQNDMCLMCHENPALFAGKPDPSRYVVTRQAHERSLHGDIGIGCTDCHRGLTFPHPQDPPKADCSFCHDDQTVQHTLSLHGQAAARGDPLAPTCAHCHGTHDIARHTNPLSPTYVFNIPLLCGECHHEGTEVSLTRNIPQDQILQNYSQSIHGAGLFRQGLAVTAVCTSCHTSHFILPHTDTRSSIHESNVAQTCAQCHALIEQVHQQFIEGRLWEAEPHKIPVCVDCHSPHKIRRVFYNAGAANQDCFRCHSDPALTMERDGETVSLYVDQAAYNASTHSETGCAQCHTDVTPSLLARPCNTTVAANVDCAICHPMEVELHSTGTHGLLAAQGNLDAPGCLDCHDNHATQDHLDPDSPTFARNVPDLCARCHREGEPGARRMELDSLPDIVNSYVMSIHGKGLLESGLVVTATCPDCHTPHHVLPADEPTSSVNPDNISATCGECHHGIEEQYIQSIHWSKRESPPEGRELPTCEDCHTSHSISRTDLGDFRLTMMNQCGRCHEEESETFFDTFHGKVSRLGDAGAAKCYDCHGTHNIHPVDDPQSTLSRRHIVDTCAKCHPGANRRFTGYLTHATHHDPHKYPFLFWSFWGMTALLVGTLTFAFMHSSAWLYRLWRSPDEWKRAKRPGNPSDPDGANPGNPADLGDPGAFGHSGGPGNPGISGHPNDPQAFYDVSVGARSLDTRTIESAANPGPESTSSSPQALPGQPPGSAYQTTGIAGELLYRRFSTFERSLHIIMMISFFILAITGMTLKFSYMSWAQWLAAAVGGFATTGVLHRLGALTLITIFVIHLVDVRRRRKVSGKTWKEFIFSD